MRTLRLVALFCLLALLLSVVPGKAQAQAPRPTPPTFNAQDAIPFDAAVAPRHAAERPQVLHPPERPAGEPRVAAARGEGRIARRGRRSAGARALHRAHGVQRQRALQAGRAGLVLRVDRRAARAARQRATPSFDETVYMLDLPTDKPEIVAKGLTALADFAGGLTLDPKEIDKERGVVIEEWRGGLGAGSRIRDKQIPVLFYHSRYAERLPIGKPEILRNAPAGAAARVLRHLVPARADGGRRRRRHRRRSSSSRRSSATFGAAQGARRGARRRRIARCRCTRKRWSASSPIRR